MSLLSFTFFFVVALTFLIYWNVNNARLQNLVILIASLAFYCLSGIRMAIILITLTFITYYCGNYIIDKPKIKTKWLCTLVVILNLGALLLFKYFNFFTEEISHMLRLMGLRVNAVTLNLIAPAGLSFYVFMLTGHIIDCWRGVFEKRADICSFFAFICFFPHLFAGPIDRSRLILPQLQNTRLFSFTQGREGLWQILNGLFKKMVVADLCGVCVNEAWGILPSCSTPTLIITTILYSLQIYCDFSGFSDIAIGTGKLFGLRLATNFKYPYFAHNVSEFWRHWHISLTSWFTEYLYIPLGGNRKGLTRTLINTVIVFTICGLWHGSNMSYLLWGMVCGLMFIPYLLQKQPKKYKDTIETLTASYALKMLITFTAISIAWIIFRGAESPEGATITYLQQLVGGGLRLEFLPYMKMALLFSCFILVCEWRTRRYEFMLQALSNFSKTARWAIYLGIEVVIFIIYMYLPAESSTDAFIYQNF